MASLGIRCGGAGDLTLPKRTLRFLDDRSALISGSSHMRSLKIPNHAGNNRISTAVNASPSYVSDRQSAPFMDFPAEKMVNREDYEYKDRCDSIESPRVSEKFDEWMRNSVTEIVKNIRQAPLLVQIYADGEVKTERAVKAEDWPRVISGRRSPSSSPDGIILVEELRDEKDAVDSGDEFADGTRAFGVLIQGKAKGRDKCKSACYLLKTSSVNGGLGILCSHFCLMKVQSFNESAFSQFNDFWLLQ